MSDGIRGITDAHSSSLTASEERVTMSDRQAQAITEAERQLRSAGRLGADRFSAGYVYGFERGVEWADVNPQPATITRADVLVIFGEVLLGRRVTPRTIVEFVRELGIEVEDDDEH